ncbi:unnamed protein product, partial [Scytosiphon promiscuus]
MLLAGLSSRSKALGLLRPSFSGLFNAGLNGEVTSTVLVLNRQAGGVPGKRRKFKGDFKA